jgi:hypothetical protein
MTEWRITEHPIIDTAAGHRRSSMTEFFYFPVREGRLKVTFLAAWSYLVWMLGAMGFFACGTFSDAGFLCLGCSVCAQSSILEMSHNSSN